MNPCIEPEATTVSPMDIFAKPNCVPEEPYSFSVDKSSYYEASEETDFDELSDVESDYSVEYIRHKSRMIDEDEEDDDCTIKSESGTINSESEGINSEPEYYEHYYAQVLPPVVIQKRGKSIALVKTHYAENMAISRLFDYQFQFRDRTQKEEEALSPTTCHVYTEDISPSGTDDFHSGDDSPDLRDNDTDEDDTISYASQETLIGDHWFANKHAEIMEMGLFY